jgi:predicted dehydrogenase
MIRLGIAGIGTIAHDYIGLIQDGRVTDVRIAALSSRNSFNLNQAMARHGLSGVQGFTDYAAMLASGLVDAVLICTPHQEHPGMARLALDHDLHILVEKPIGVDPADVRHLLEHLAKHPYLTGGVLYNRRQASAYQRIKQLMLEGAIGDLVRVTWLITNLYRTHAYYRTSPWRGTWAGEGGGLLMTQASHQLDLLLWLCGLPQSVQAFCRTVDREIDVENEAALFLQYPGNAWGQFIASARETPGTNRLEICGTKGQIVIENDSLVRVCTLAEDEREFARSATGSFVQPSQACEEFIHHDQDNRVQQAAAIQNFVDTIAGKASIACSLADAADSLAIIQAAYLSNWTGQEVSVPPPEARFLAELAHHS